MHPLFKEYKVKDLQAEMFTSLEGAEATVVFPEGGEVKGTLEKVTCRKREDDEFQHRDPFTLMLKFPPDEKLCDGTYVIKIGDVTLEGAYISQCSPIGKCVYFGCSFN